MTSTTEQDLRRRLTDAGLPLHPGRSALQCGFDETSGSWPVLTPDYLIRDSRVCIEFDSGYTHKGKEDTDHRRNQFLNGIGWTVIRLRTGGLPPLGPYDVTTDTMSFTIAAVAALVESAQDAIAGRPGTVRHIARVPRRARTVSRLGAIAPHKHVENAFYASWTLNSGDVARFVIMAGGHFLGATGAGWGTPAFVLRLGLDRLPRARWRHNLEELLTGLPDESLEPVSRFPWGDDLFNCEPAADVPVDHKFNVGAHAHIGTFTLPPIPSWTASTLTVTGGRSLALHPDAIDAGWRFADLRHFTGHDGSYHRYLLLRDLPRQGLWAPHPQTRP